eukprot:4772236-Prymnesium_polylepis.1
MLVACFVCVQKEHTPAVLPAPLHQSANPCGGAHLSTLRGGVGVRPHEHSHAERCKCSTGVGNGGGRVTDEQDRAEAM